MAFQLILGFLQILDILGVMYQPLVKHRFEYTSFTVGVNLIWPMVGLLVLSVVHSLRSKETRSLLACAPLLFAVFHPELGLSLASLSFVAVSLTYTENKRRFFHALLMVLILFNSLGVIHYGILLPLGVPSPFTGLASLQLNVHYVLTTVAPFLVFPFLYFWFLKPLLNTAFVLPRHRFLERRVDGFSRLLLAFAVYISIYSAVYPYFPAINPKQMLFAADIQRYTTAMEMRFNAETTLLEVIGMGRAFFYLFFNAFQRILGLEVHQALSALPILLNPLFVLASYFFLWECFRNSHVAAWGSFFASTGHVITAGMFMNYLSNNLALVLVFSSLGLLLRAVRRTSVPCLSAASFLAALLVYTHPWTMLQFFAAVVTAVGAAFILSWFGVREIDPYWVRYAAVFLAAVFLSEATAVLVFHSASGVSTTSDVIGGTSYVTGFWGRVVESFKFSGGLMAGWGPLLLATIGVYTMQSEKHSHSYLAYLVALSSLVYLFTESTVKARLFYNLPLWLFAAVGLSALEERFDDSVLVFAVLNSLLYLFMSLANIVY
jgi:hypothetical protein